MNCKKFEAGMALYAGGDLTPGRVSRIEQHLAQCPDCRMLVEELHSARASLAEMKDEPIDEAMVANVRRNVLSRIGTRRPLRLSWAFALAAGVVLAVILAWPRQHEEAPRRIASVSRTPAAGPLPPAASKELRKTGRPAPLKSSEFLSCVAARDQLPLCAHRAALTHKRPRPPRPAAHPSEPLLVQFVTDDPNIVIYWIVDPNKQGD